MAYLEGLGKVAALPCLERLGGVVGSQLVGRVGLRISTAHLCVTSVRPSEP
jgi:hypothetical protein